MIHVTDEVKHLLCESKIAELAVMIMYLLRTAGRFIDQRHKRQGRIISISIADIVFTLMQI